MGTTMSSSPTTTTTSSSSSTGAPTPTNTNSVAVEEQQQRDDDDEEDDDDDVTTTHVVVSRSNSSTTMSIISSSSLSTTEASTNSNNNNNNKKRQRVSSDDDATTEEEGAEEEPSSSSSSSRKKKKKKATGQLKRDEDYDDDDDDKDVAGEEKQQEGGGNDQSEAEEDEVDVDEEVVFVDNNKQRQKNTTKFDKTDGDNNDDDDDEEIQLLATNVQNPLTEFPHSRENCLVYPIMSSDDANNDPVLLFCPNCYCYVCDEPASTCPNWAESHCHATHTDPKWRRARSDAKNKNHASSSVAASSSSSSSYYAYRSYSSYRSYFSVKQLLECVTRIHPHEVTPPTPLFQTNLHHYQKQALAFLLNNEQQQQHNGASSGTRTEKQKSSWLCSEVGMGKTAVVIALVASNPMPLEEQPSLDDVKLASRRSKKKLDVKATIVYTSVSLLGQWEDEVQKHAPSLKVYRHHPTSKMKIANLAEADIVVTTATFKWASVLTTSFRFHRIVVDESHLMGTSSCRWEYVLALESERRLCVTATPFTTSFDDLERQIGFLNLEEEESRLANDVFLQRYMIRHIKSQLINGAPALALPKSTTTLKMVPMTTWERKTFNRALYDNHNHERIVFRGYNIQTRMLEMRWYARIAQPMMCEDSSKVEILKKDLKALLVKEPNMRAVVYTQFLQQQKFVKKAIQQDMGIKTYVFNGSLAPDVRDNYIREFQNDEVTSSAGDSGGGPAVFLVTIKAGSVGITLTAASHVFLLEPCIDPATEFQAAGRIHRLGQKKQVGVTKYVFENSFESKILELQQKIENGDIEYKTGVLSNDALRALRLPTPAPPSESELQQERDEILQAEEDELKRSVKEAMQSCFKC